jgi:hypothetical protein
VHRVHPGEVGRRKPSHRGERLSCAGVQDCTSITTVALSGTKNPCCAKCSHACRVTALHVKLSAKCGEGWLKNLTWRRRMRQGVPGLILEIARHLDGIPREHAATSLVHIGHLHAWHHRNASLCAVLLQRCWVILCMLPVQVHGH